MPSGGDRVRSGPGAVLTSPVPRASGSRGRGPKGTRSRECEGPRRPAGASPPPPVTSRPFRSPGALRALAEAPGCPAAGEGLALTKASLVRKLALEVSDPRHPVPRGPPPSSPMEDSTCASPPSSRHSRAPRRPVAAREAEPRRLPAAQLAQATAGGMGFGTWCSAQLGRPSWELPPPAPGNGCASCLAAAAGGEQVRRGSR